MRRVGTSYDQHTVGTLEASPSKVTILAGQKAYNKYFEGNLKSARGYPHENNGVIFVPTWGLHTVLKQQPMFPILCMDIMKACHIELGKVPPITTLCVPESPEEIQDWLTGAIGKPLVLDIETAGDTITEVGMAYSPHDAICIPFLKRPNESYWSEEAEPVVWSIIRYVCQTHRLIGQNFAYDMKWLWQKMGIPCPNFVEDTMLLHHAYQPEMEKGLGFLASMYTNRPVWKHLRMSTRRSD